MDVINRELQRIKDSIKIIEGYVKASEDVNISKEKRPVVHKLTSQLLQNDFLKNRFLNRPEDLNEYIELYGYQESKNYKIDYSETMAINQEEKIQLAEGTLSYRQKEKRWMGRYYDEGKRKWVYGKTKKECAERLKEALRERDERLKNNVINKNMFFDEWWQHWYTTYKLKKLKKSSAIVLERYYQYHLKEPLKSKKINSIRGIDIQKILNKIESDSSRKKCYEQLCDCFRTLMKNHLIGANPMEAVELNIRKKKSTKRSITFEEEMALIEGFKGYWIGDLAILILHTGLRKGEALALTWEDIDFKNNSISISKAYDRYSKSITTPKSDCSNRIIPLFPKAKKILEKLKETSETKEVFGNCSKANVGELFKKKLRKTTLADDITLHVLRHTFATRIMEAGVSEKVRQQWLGHSSVEITNNIYTHVNNYFETTEIELMSTYIKEKI